VTVMYSVVQEGWAEIAQAFLCFCKLGSLLLILFSCSIQSREAWICLSFF